MTPCGGSRLEGRGRRRFRPGHSVEIEQVGIAVRLPTAALATKDDEPTESWVIPHGRVHQRRRASPRRRDPEPLCQRKEATVSGKVVSGEQGAGTYLEGWNRPRS